MRKERRWRAAVPLALGVALGIALTASPAGSHVASWTHNWSKHIKPKADTRYLPGGNLPRGSTLRGAYRVTAQGFGSVPISFGFRLASAPSAHFIPAGASPPAACPGTARNPRAARGHLCVYEVTNINVQTREIINPVNNNLGASRYGANIFAESDGVSLVVSGGTWAVKSP